MRHGIRLIPVLVVAVSLIFSGCVSIDSASGPHVDLDGSSPTGVPDGDVTVTIERVVDGDTFKVSYRNGTADTIRLIGVDTPEVHAENTPAEFEGVPETAAGRDCLGRWGERASTYATNALSGVTVQLAFDENLDRRGYYGRLLAYVIVDGRSFNRRLVTHGYARVYDSEFSRRATYLDLESNARADAIGLWECATADPPTTDSGAGSPTRTRSSTGLAVAEIHADADGNDHENLHDEYVVLVNRGESALDLSGWTITDEAGKVYAFPDGFNLPADASVTLYTGAGSDTETALYWGRDSPVWNNDGDTVIVHDASGNVVIRASYGA